uniref:Uncharacterized protein n=1 Tax=Florenciella parvula TaxID=236787 RepID=A0A7S2GAE4_9STRA|mmetsp:Transcript_7091/g.14722  ORF Transcript_7091/g.14722 Transcript_7091/m.14722 type:complete len:144 (+) Transcript_7091:246-677(+)
MTHGPSILTITAPTPTTAHGGLWPAVCLPPPSTMVRFGHGHNSHDYVPGDLSTYDNYGNHDDRGAYEQYARPTRPPPPPPPPSPTTTTTTTATTPTPTPTLTPTPTPTHQPQPPTRQLRCCRHRPGRFFLEPFEICVPFNFDF